MLNFGVPYQLLRPWDVTTVPRLIESRSYLIKMKKKERSDFAFAAEDEHCIHQDVF